MKTLHSRLHQLSGLVGRNLSRSCFQLGQRSLQLFFRTCALPAFFVLASTSQAVPVTISWSGWVTSTSDGFGAIGSEVFQTLTYDTTSPGLNPGVGADRAPFEWYQGISYSVQSGTKTITNSVSGDFSIVISPNGVIGPGHSIYFGQNNGNVFGGSGAVRVDGNDTAFGFRNRLWDSTSTLLLGNQNQNQNLESLPTSLPNLPGLLANINPNSTFSGDLYSEGNAYGDLLLAWDSAAPRIISSAPESVPDHTGVGSLIMALIGVAVVRRFKRTSARP
jgi:hypothetical protein